jgi:hypothetical protein
MAAVLLRCSMGSNLRHVVRSSTNFQLDGFEFRFPATETPGKKERIPFFYYLCYFILFFLKSTRNVRFDSHHRAKLFFLAPWFFSEDFLSFYRVNRTLGSRLHSSSFRFCMGSASGMAFNLALVSHYPAIQLLTAGDRMAQFQSSCRENWSMALIDVETWYSATFHASRLLKQ